MDEVFTAGQLAAVDELYAPDLVNHVPPSLGRDLQGHDHVKRFATHWSSALPDLVHAVKDVRADRDMVVVHWRARGTHQEPLWGVGPTGRQIDVPACERSRVHNGRIAEQWLALDTLGLAQQLGIAPCLPASRAVGGPLGVQGRTLVFDHDVQLMEREARAEARRRHWLPLERPAPWSWSR